MEKNFKKQPRKRIGGNKRNGVENETKFDKKKFVSENRHNVEETKVKKQISEKPKKTYTEVYDTRYNGIELPKGSAKTHILQKDYDAITVQGKKSLLKKGQLCMLYSNNILQSADGRLARY